MIKVLDASKTLTELASDTSNGLGRLTVMNDSVTEELNGIYELEFDVLTSDKHYEDLKNNRLVKVNVDETGNEQIFRVYNIGEPINLVSHIKCQHITYDLAKVVVKPFSATGAANIKNALKSNMLGTYPFTTWTDITNTTSTFTNDIPRSFRECLGGYEGSVLDVLRCEYEWNNLQVKICARRGSDHGTRIAYGKNLTDFQQEENNESVYDAVYGYAVIDEATYQASDIYNKTGASFPKVLNVDFSGKYESGETPTPEELLSYAEQYANSNDIEVPNVNIKISFVPLWQTEEYKDIAPLERVFLGDTVHVYFDKLNVEANARVIKTVWIPSLGRYESIELGSARSNLNTIITDTVKQETESIVDSINVDTGFIEKELDDLSRLIINGLGLYRTEVEIAGGGVRYILHNRPELADSDVQYYMSAAGIMVSTDFGVTWDAGYDTSTGELFTQALSTIVLKALEIYGSTISFGDMNDKYITASVYTNSSDEAQGVSFDGTGTIRMQPQDRFYVNNLTADGENMYNQIIMNKLGSTYRANYIELQNFDDKNNFLLANFIELDAHRYNSTEDAEYNRTIINNYSTLTGTRYSANYLSFLSYTDKNYAYLYNYKPQSSNIANRIQLSATPTSCSTFMYNMMVSANNSANSISMTGTSTGNSFALYNQRIDSDTSISANTLQLNCSIYNSAVTNSATLTNFRWNKSGTSSVDYANRVALSSAGNTSKNSLELENYKIDNNRTANNIYMNTGSSSSNIDIANYMYNDTSNSHYMANSVSLISDSARNKIELRNRDGASASADSNVFYIQKTSTSSDIYAANYQLGSVGTVANAFSMTSDTSNGNTISFINRSSNNTVMNSITLKSDKTMVLFCKSDMRLYSEGAIRLSANTTESGGSSGTTQDIHLTGYSLHFYYTSNFAVHKGSARYNLQFNSDGSVTWS